MNLVYLTTEYIVKYICAGVYIFIIFCKATSVNGRNLFSALHSLSAVRHDSGVKILKIAVFKSPGSAFKCRHIKGVAAQLQQQRSATVTGDK